MYISVLYVYWYYQSMDHRCCPDRVATIAFKYNTRHILQYTCHYLCLNISGVQILFISIVRYRSITTMPEFKLTHQDNLLIITLYRQSWPVHAIINKIDARSVDVTWSTVKHVIKRYQTGKATKTCKRKKLPTFRYLTDHNIIFVKNTLKENPTQTSSDIQRLLSDKGSHTSKSTVNKAISAAGYTASSHRYGSGTK